MNKQALIIELLAPYYHNPSICGYDTFANDCVYLTDNGKMCVAGKCMVDPSSIPVGGIDDLLHMKGQSIFQHKYRGVFSQNEWKSMQQIHDAIAINFNSEHPSPIDVRIRMPLLRELNITIEDLKNWKPAVS